MAITGIAIRTIFPIARPLGHEYITPIRGYIYLYCFNPPWGLLSQMSGDMI